MKRNLVLGITGASGSIYAVRLLEVVIAAGYDVHLTITPSAQLVLKQELGQQLPLLKQTLSDALGLNTDIQVPFQTKLDPSAALQNLGSQLQSAGFTVSKVELDADWAVSLGT